MAHITKSDPRSTSSCLNLVAAWAANLHGQGNTAVTLQHLMDLVRADALVFARFEEDQARPKVLCRVDPRSTQIPAGPGCPPMARVILGQHLSAVRPGTVWVKSESAELSLTADQARMDELVSTFGVQDIVLIAMATGAGSSDFLELHFGTTISTADRDLLKIISSTMSNSWHLRKDGTARALIKAARTAGVDFRDEVAQRAVLDVENPVGLSRSEYRVCTLMKGGLVVRKIARKLDIKESTVRSHLRSIYAKTETSGQVELLHRLAQDQAG